MTIVMAYFSVAHCLLRYDNYLYLQYVRKKTPSKDLEDPEYILGTIIARVVAARSLHNPCQRENGGGFGGVFRGSSVQGTGTNPYASIKFGKTTQRTSGLYSTMDPVWPRDEVFFMDVSLPTSKLTHGSETETETGPTTEAHESPELLGDPFHGYQPPDNTTLTVAIFHSEMGNSNHSSHNVTKSKLCNEGTVSGDSDDTFLGMASIDLTALLTGRVTEFDEWIPLNGTASDHNNQQNGRPSDHRSSRRPGSRRASVRVVCEYEPVHPGPNPGDTCRFTRFCHPRDLYPLEPARSYRVDRVLDNGDVAMLSYESQEGWVLSFQAHKNMLVCEERHVSPLDLAQDELQTLGERLSVSPLVATVTETAERIADDGLLGVAESIVWGGAFVFDRWFKGGVETIIQDLQDVTNLDGRHNRETPGQTLDIESTSSSSSLEGDSNADIDAEGTSPDAFEEEEEEIGQALPNMPPCPITGEPMIDPVVAADGHTYERRAIARWLTTSDKSPLTGSVLVHKELVPNYGLLSSIEAAAARQENDSKTNVTSSTNSIDERKPPPNADAHAHA
eukprot:jgi/Psemu1/320337/estExt_fgenesh1_pm.C_5120001